jgi:hypothetical protein
MMKQLYTSILDSRPRGLCAEHSSPDTSGLIQTIFTATEGEAEQWIRYFYPNPIVR